MGVYEDTIALAVLDLPCQDNAASTDVVNNAGNDATLTNAGNTEDIDKTGPTSWLTSGLHLNETGNNDHILLDAPFTVTGEFAVEFWLDRDNETEHTIICDSATNTDRIILDNNNGGTDARIVLNSSGVSITNGAKISSDGWTHYVCVRNSDNTFSWYVNGSLVETTVITLSGDATFGIVGARNDLSRDLNGILANVRVWDQGLTALQVSALFTGPTSYEDLLTDANLVHRWNGDANDDGTGDQNDAIGSANGTSSSQTYSDDLPFATADGKSFVFSDTNAESINCGGIPTFATEDFSIVCWVKTTATNNFEGVWNIDSDLILWTQDSGVNLDVLSGGSLPTDYRTAGSQGDVNDGNWHYIGINFTGGRADIYWDGVLDETGTGTGTWVDMSGDNFYIGAGTGAFNSWVGNLWSLMIYSRVLTATEHAVLAAGPTVTPSSNIQLFTMHLLKILHQ